MPRGRKRIIQITPEVFEGMCRVQCTETEIAKILGCSIDTLRRWVRITYKANFATVYANHAEVGKLSLRRAQMRMAETIPTMAIWCGKQYLGQHDKIEIDHHIETEIERELARLAPASEAEVSGTPEGDTNSRYVS